MHFPRFTLFFLLAALALPIAGCDSDSSDDDDEYAPILGRWEALGDPNESDVYLNIGDDEIVAHFFDDEEGEDTACFVRETFDVVSRTGSTWRIRYEDGETDDVVFRRNGDDLLSEDPDIADADLVRFERSTRTVFTPMCSI